MEFFDHSCCELVMKYFDQRNPLKPSPFYVLVETTGSNEEHDKEVSEQNTLYVYGCQVLFLFCA